MTPSTQDTQGRSNSPGPTPRPAPTLDIQTTFSKTFNVLPPSLFPPKKQKPDLKPSHSFPAPFTNPPLRVRRFVLYKELDAYESQSIEFKNLKSLNAKMVCNYICGFLNASGGTLLIGICDKGVVRGIHLKRAQIDEFQLELDRNLRQFVPPVFPEQVHISFEKVYAASKKEIRDKFVVRIDVLEERRGAVFTTNDGNVFLKKKGSLHCLKPAEIVNFMKRRIKK